MPIGDNTLDDVPDRQKTEGFLGMDCARNPTKLPPELVADGLNMWCRGDGYLETRPGLKIVCNMRQQFAASPTDPYFQSGTYDDEIKALFFYDQPSEEYVITITNEYLWSLPSAGNLVSATWRVNGYVGIAPTIQVCQLVNRIFFLISGVLYHATLTAGVWAAGSVTTFSTAAAMPSWSRIMVHGFRVLAYDPAAQKLYASAVGQANAAADWVPTENIRVGEGEGDPAIAIIGNQGSFVTMLCERAVYAIDTSAASVANWTSKRLTKAAGCVAPESAIALNQDVFFLSRFGVVNLAALETLDSISPAAALSAPIQAYIDRINWTYASRAFCTTWGELLLVALPLDSDTYPKHVFPFHLRTRQWQTPWVYVPGTNATANNATTCAYAGIVCACVTMFAGKPETLIGDTAGRVFRIDDTVNTDMGDPTAAATSFESWALLRRMDHGDTQQAKQPMFVELVTQGSTGVDTRVALTRDGAAHATAAGTFADGRQVGTTYTGAGGLEKKRFFARGHSRYHEAALQLWATSGKLKVREAALSAFLDPPMFPT